MYTLVNGTFDILHPGHVALLSFAKGLNPRNTLIVAIDSDDRVAKLKGPTRPINDELTRGTMLMALKGVSDVRIFSSNEGLRGLVKHYSPEYMVVGAEYKDKDVIGSEYAQCLVFFRNISGYSTSKTIKSIANR